MFSPVYPGARWMEGRPGSLPERLVDPRDRSNVTAPSRGASIVTAPLPAPIYVVLTRLRSYQDRTIKIGVDLRGATSENSVAIPATGETEGAVASPPRIQRYTPEEYLTMEAKADFKSEYCDGFITAMAGASREHNLIAGNLHGEIRSQLKARRCEVYMSDMRLSVSRTGLYTYPDVMAVCGEPQFEGDEVKTLLNPTVIIEVLSDSTESYDRGRKFGHYRRLPSLQESILVAQDEVKVERYVRRGDDWVLTEMSQLDDTLHITSIDCEVPLREIYAKVAFSGKSANL
jgi:Uma2 family endonuclease